MSRVSQNLLSPNYLEEIQSSFDWAISKLSKEEEIKNFFDEFLTRSERIMLAKRLILIFLISKEFDAISIYSILKVSPTTVVYFKEKFQKRPENFQPVLDQLARRESLKNLFKKIEKFIEPVAAFMPPATKSEVLKKLRRISRS
ncbi:MAG: hypothetical protein HYV52_00980 [Parcubacteria group bacterium]|nr:hypothetical protein [Parcubacteria group bacterium]